jgi:hypothetical protein
MGQEVFITPNTDDLSFKLELDVIIAILAGMNKAHEALYNINSGVTCCHVDT